MIRVLLAAIIPTVVFLYVAILNPQSVTFKLTKTHSYSLPMAAVVVVLVVAGFVAALVIMAGGELRGALKRAKEKRRWKAHEKKMALFRAALGWFEAGDLARARALLKRLLSMDSKFLEGLILMGVVAKEEGNKEEALSWHRKARRIVEDDPWLLYQLYRDYVATGEWEEALDALETLMKKAKPSVGLYRELMKVHLELGEVDKALALQGKIVKMVPPQERAGEEKRLLWMLYEKARKEGDRGLMGKLARDNPSFAPAVVALVEMNSEKKNKVVDVVKKACETNPRILVLFDKLEDLLLSEERPGEIISFYKRLMSRYSKNPLIPFVLARLYFSLGMYQDAQKAVLSLEVAPPPVNFLKGLILGRLGEGEKALQLFSQGLGRDMGVHYSCEGCGCMVLQWQDKCPGCGEGGSLVVDLGGGVDEV